MFRNDLRLLYYYLEDTNGGNLEHIDDINVFDSLGGHFNSILNSIEEFKKIKKEADLNSSGEWREIRDNILDKILKSDFLNLIPIDSSYKQRILTIIWELFPSRDSIIFKLLGHKLIVDGLTNEGLVVPLKSYSKYDPNTVYRVDERGNVFYLVALQWADKMPFDVTGQDFLFSCQFLGPAFTKYTLSRIVGFLQCLDGMELGDRYQRDTCRQRCFQSCYIFSDVHASFVSACFFCSAISSSSDLFSAGTLLASKGKTSISGVSVTDAMV